LAQTKVGPGETFTWRSNQIDANKNEVPGSRFADERRVGIGIGAVSIPVFVWFVCYFLKLRSLRASGL